MASHITLLLKLSLWGYGIGAMAGLICLRRERWAACLASLAAVFGAGCGIVASSLFLSSAWQSEPLSFSLLPALIPYLQFTIQLNPLGAFFLLILSLLALALSIYSFGYVRGFFGRKNVGLLGAFYNSL